MELSFTPKVLLVDDSKWELELFHSILEDQCYVEKESKALNAVERAKSINPDIIVLDMIMPEIEGIEVLKRLKADEKTQHIAVIMVTAYSRNEDCIVKCIELGASDYLFKPISEEILKAKISRAALMQHTENSLRKSLEHNNQLMDAISSIIIGVDCHKCISYWNSVAESYFYLSMGDVIGKPIANLGIDWNCEEIIINANCYLQDSSCKNRFDVNYQCKQNGSRILSICIAPFISTDGDKSEFLIIADDITESKVQQSYDHQTERLQSIGQLAAGIAHEINTPIQYVGDNTYFLQDSFQELVDVISSTKDLAKQLGDKKDNSQFRRELDELYENCDYDYLVEDVPKAIEQSLEGIDRIATIVKAMKDFSHPGSEQKDSTDINRAIESTVTVARNVWKYTAELEMDLDPEMGEFICYTGPFNEVVLNIIVNAAHAIDENTPSEEKGIICVKTKRYEKYGEIRIQDSGSGIPEHLQSKIFDPFFTTKEVGKGTGQGLSLCHNIIVEQHNGELYFETVEGKGTTFIIHLPNAGLDCGS